MPILLHVPGHVLHVAQPAEGGVPSVVLRHVRAQVDAGWRVSLACPPRLTAPALTPPAAVRHVPWESARAPDLSLLHEVRWMARLLADTAPDVVHLHSAKAGLIGRLAVRGVVPTVFQPHAWSFHAASPSMRRATVAWERRAARWTERLLCVSEDERDEGLRAGVRGQYEVIPNGVDLQQFPAATNLDRNAARHRLSLPAGPLAVCVGRLMTQKGQDVLVRAWREVRERLPEARLALVGDGPLREELGAQTGDGVDMFGASEDVQSWYAAADVVVVPSRWEGMALVPLEALATSRSVVASAVAGVRESVPPEAGALVPAENASALVEALTLRLADRRTADAEGERGRRFVTQHRDVGALTVRLMRLYDDVLARPGAT